MDRISTGRLGGSRPHGPVQMERHMIVPTRGPDSRTPSAGSSLRPAVCGLGDRRATRGRAPLHEAAQADYTTDTNQPPCTIAPAPWPQVITASTPAPCTPKAIWRESAIKLFNATGCPSQGLTYQPHTDATLAERSDMTRIRARSPLAVATRAAEAATIAFHVEFSTIATI